MEKRTHKRTHRSCIICSSNDCQPFCNFTDAVQGRVFSWSFETTISICKKCGFTFSSPAPNEEFFNEYYADDVRSPASVAPSYDPKKRLNYLQKISSRDGVLLDYGSGSRTDFHTRATELFKGVYLFDTGTCEDVDFTDVSKIDQNFADVITLYSSLQYLFYPEERLKEINSLLKPNGFLVCEVPDLRMYHLDTSAFRLYEHLSHFTLASLRVLCARAGLELVETCPDYSSRAGEMLACFRKTTRELRVPITNEYEDNLKSLSLASVEYNKLIGNFDQIYRTIKERSLSGEKVVCWAANGYMRALFEGRAIPNGVTLVDINPLKEDAIVGGRVVTPQSIEGKLGSINLLICCSKYQSESIYQQFKELGGPDLEGEDFIVL